MSGAGIVPAAEPSASARRLRRAPASSGLRLSQCTFRVRRQPNRLAGPSARADFGGRSPAGRAQKTARRSLQAGGRFWQAGGRF